MTASGDSLPGLWFVDNIRVVFSAGAAGNSVLVTNSQGSTIFHAIADGANFTDGWGIREIVSNPKIAALTGDAEVYIKIKK